MTITRYRLRKAWEVFYFWFTVGYVHKVSIFYRLRAGIKCARWYFLYEKGSFQEDTPNPASSSRN